MFMDGRTDGRTDRRWTDARLIAISPENRLTVFFFILFYFFFLFFFYLFFFFCFVLFFCHYMLHAFEVPLSQSVIPFFAFVALHVSSFAALSVSR